MSSDNYNQLCKRVYIFYGPCDHKTAQRHKNNPKINQNKHKLQNYITDLNQTKRIYQFGFYKTKRIT